MSKPSLQTSTSVLTLDVWTENVYQREEAVKSYLRFAEYPPEMFQTIARKLDRLDVFDKQCLRVLDLGIGSGAFAIPLLRALRDAGYQAEITGLDNSPVMIDAGRKALENAGLKGVSWNLYDLEKGLAHLSKGIYSLVVTTFVLHYVKRWREIVEQIHDLLPGGGIWLISQSTGDIPLMEAEWDKADSVNKQLADFWRAYHDQRRLIVPFDAELKTSSMEPVIEEAIRYFSIHCSFEVRWNKDVTWLEIVSWIRAGIIAALGSGIDERQRERLAKYMIGWLRQQQTFPNDKISFQMGVKFHVLQR